MDKEYACMECGNKFKRNEKKQNKLYAEMGILADQCVNCLRKM